MRSSRYDTASLSSSSSSSYIDISRTFPRNRFGGALKTFFTAPSERRRARRKKSARLLALSNSSSSSVNSDLAYGTGFLRKPKHHKVRSRNGKERESERDRESARGSDRERQGLGRRVATEAEILAVGAGLREIARKQNQLDLRTARDGKRPEGYSSRDPRQRGEYGTSRGLAPSKGSYGSDSFEEDGWESASDEESDYSVDSKLAYGSVVAGSSWGAAPERSRPQRSSSGIVDPRLFGPQNSLRGIVTEPVGYEQVEWDQHSDFGQPTTFGKSPRPESAASTSLPSLQHVYPIPTSDPDRFEASRGSVISANPEPYISSRHDPITIQQPQPITPVSQSVYEPGYAARSESGILKRNNSSSGRGKSLAEAALAGVAGAAIGAAFSSDKKSDVSKRRDDEDSTVSRRRESSKNESKEDRQREKKRDSPDRDRREKRREKDKDKDDDSRREKKREKRRDEPREETKEERRERRREERRSERGEDDRRSKSDIGTSVVSTRSVDPFQYQVDDDAFPTPTFDKPTESSSHRRIESVPTVVTVDREPDFTRKRSSSIKDRPSASRSESGRAYDRDERDQRYTQSDVHDGRRTYQDAENMYQETEHSTAPIAIGAIGAAVAAVTAEGFRESRSERRRGERRGDYDEPKTREQEFRNEPERDPVLEEADRTYREIVMARKIASSVIRSRSSSPERSVVHKYDRHHDDHEEQAVKIVTPPEMEHHKQKGPYDAPNADFKLDHILTPKDLESFSSPVRISSDPSYFDRDSRLPNERPLLNLVQPTPIPSPLPERKFEYTEKPHSSDSKQERQVSSSEVGQSTQPKAETYVSRSEVGQSSRYQGRGRSSNSEPDVIIGPRGTIIPSPTASAVSKGVTWGENETKHYEVESPSTSPVRSRDRSDGSRSATDDSRSKGWAAITAGIVGAGAGAAIANNSETSSKSKSKDTGIEPAKPYEYRGIIVEPESPPRSSERRSPPATGPKPISPQNAHVPGSFEDDIDFTATLAAGLQDSGFDPNIVINDPKYHRRTSPPGSNETGVYQAPFVETVSDLGTFKHDSPGPEGAPPIRGYIMGEIPETPKEEQTARVDFDDDFSQLSKKEQKKREKAVKRQSSDVPPGMEAPFTEVVKELEDYFDTPKLSKKEQKKRDKALQRQDSLPDETPPIVDERYPAEKAIVEEPESYFDEPKKSKKKSKKSGSATFDEETTPIVDDYQEPKSIVEEPESYFEPSKKSKKKSKKSAPGYDDETPDQWQDAQTTVSVPIDAYTDIQNGDSYATPPAVDEWDTPKKSKKKPKRDSDRYDSPSHSVAASEVGSESGKSSSRKSKDKSRKKGDSYDTEVDPSEVPLPMITPSEASRDDYDDSRKTRRSARDSGIFDSADRGDSRSVVSMGASRYEDEHRKHKKKHRSSRDDDDTKSIASAPAGDDWEDSKKTKKKDKRSSGSFFGLFGSKSEPEPKEPAPKDEADEPKRKKKSKRSSTLSLDDYNDNGSSVGKSNGNGYHDDFADDYKNGDEKRKKDSFLDNAGTLGAGVGLAGVAALMAAQHQQSKAANTNREEAEEQLSQGSDLPFRQERRSYDMVDPEISERHFRPSIDPQYGDLLPLPPSGPPSPDAEPIDELPGLPESRPTTPVSDRRTARDKSSTRRNLLDAPMKSPSQSAVPLKFIMGNRPPSSPVAARPNPFSSPQAASSAENLSSPRTRGRPTSWDSTKEYKPLYLVESNRRSSFVENPESAEILPALPASRTTSRSSSQLEDAEREAEDTGTHTTKTPLFIDTGIAQQSAVDFLNSEQSTPKADTFDRFDHTKIDNAEVTSADKSGDIAAGAIGGAALASAIGYLASSHSSDPKRSSEVEKSSSESVVLPEQHSAVDPLVEVKDLHSLQSSPPSNLGEDLKSDNDDVFHDTQEVPSLDVHALPQIQDRDGSDIFGTQQDVSAQIESKSVVPDNSLIDVPNEDVEISGFSKSKKDKKKDKKSRKSASEFSTQDGIALPDSNAPISDEAAIIDDLVISEGSKKSKKKNKSSWEPEPEPEIVPELSELVQETSSKEPDIFAAPEPKKGKKKKGKVSSDWEPQPEPEVVTETIGAAEQEPIQKPASQDFVSQEAEDYFAMPASKKSKKKKGKASVSLEPEAESVTPIETKPEIAPEVVPEILPVDRSIAQESEARELEDFTISGSKKGKKKKGKMLADWEPEPEPELEISSKIEEPQPIVDTPSQEIEEFSVSSSKKGKKKKGKAVLDMDASPIPTPEVEDTPVSTPTVEVEDFALPISKKSKKKKGKSTVDWDAIPEPELGIEKDMPVAAGSTDPDAAIDPSVPVTDLDVPEQVISSEIIPLSEEAASRTLAPVAPISDVPSADTPVPDALITDTPASDSSKVLRQETSFQDTVEHNMVDSESPLLPTSKKDKKKKKGKATIDWDAVPDPTSEPVAPPEAVLANVPLPETPNADIPGDLTDPVASMHDIAEQPPTDSGDIFPTSSKKDKKKKKSKSAIDWESVPEPTQESEGTQSTKDVTEPTVVETPSISTPSEEPTDFVVPGSKKGKKKKKGKAAVNWDIEPETESKPELEADVEGQSTSKYSDGDPVVHTPIEEPDVFSVPGSKKGKKKNKASINWDTVPESFSGPTAEDAFQSGTDPTIESLQPNTEHTTGSIAPVLEPTREAINASAEAQFPEATSESTNDATAQTIINPGIDTNVESTIDPSVDPSQENILAKPDDEILQSLTSGSKKSKKKKGKAAFDWETEPEQSRELVDESIPQTPVEQAEPDTLFTTSGSKKNKKSKSKSTTDWDDNAELNRELTADSTSQTPLEEKDEFSLPSSKKNKKKKGKSTPDWEAEPETILASVTEPVSAPENAMDAPTDSTPLETVDDFESPSTKKNKKKKGKSKFDLEAEIPPSEEFVSEPQPEPTEEFVTSGSKKSKKKKGKSTIDWDAVPEPVSESVPESLPVPIDEETKVPVDALADIPVEAPVEAPAETVVTSETLDALQNPIVEQEAKLETKEPDVFVTSGSKSKKKKGKPAINWDEVPEPQEEPVAESPVELSSQKEIIESDDFAMPTSKKDKKKKKDESAIDWDAVPEPTEENLAESQPIPEPEIINDAVEEAITETPAEDLDTFVQSVSKKDKKKKKGKPAIDWDAVPEPIEETTTEAEPIAEAEIVTEALAAEPELTEVPVENPDFAAPSKERDTLVQSGSKKDKKKKSKSTLDWDVEPEPVPEPIQEEVPDEFSLPSSKKDKKKKKGKQATSWDPEPASEQEPVPEPDTSADQVEPPPPESIASPISNQKKNVIQEQTRSISEEQASAADQHKDSPDTPVAAPSPHGEVDSENAILSQEPPAIEPVSQGIEATPELTPAEQVDYFTTSSTKKNKKKGKKTQDWTAEENEFLPISSESVPDSQETYEFAMPGSKKSKKNSKKSGSSTPEIIHEPHNDPGDLPTNQQGGLSMDIVRPDASEEFNIPVSKKDKKKSKKLQSWSLEDDVTKDFESTGETDTDSQNKQDSQLIDSPKTEEADNFSLPSSKKGKKKGKKTLSWTPEENENLSLSHDTSMSNEGKHIDEAVPPQDDVLPLNSDQIPLPIAADLTLVEAQSGTESLAPEGLASADSTGTPEEQLADDFQQSKDFSPKSKKSKKKSKSTAAAWEDDIESRDSAETNSEVPDVPDSVTEFEMPSKSKKSKKKSKSSHWEEEVPPTEQSSTDSAVDEFGSSEPSSDVATDEFGPAMNKKSKRKSKLSQVWVADDTPVEEVAFEEPNETVATIEEPAAEPGIFSPKGSKKSKKSKSNSAFTWDDETLPVNSSVEAVESGSTNIEQTESVEPDEFVMPGSKKNKKKSKKLQTPDAESEPSWDDIEAMTSATSPLGKANLDPSPQTEYPGDSSTPNSKKSKKSKKSQAREIVEDPIESPAEQIQEKPVEPTEPLAEELSLSSKPTPLGGPGAWPATPVTPIASTSELRDLPKTDYFTAAGSTEAVSGPDVVVATESPGGENETRKSNVDGFDVGYNEEQLRLAKQMQEEFGSGSKKSKKDKKKRQSSLPPTPEFDESRSRQPDAILDTTSRSRSLSNGPGPASTDPPSATASEVRQNLYTEEQLELARQLKAEQEIGGKKSKKDKKKRPGNSRTSTYNDDVLDSAAEDLRIEDPANTNIDTPNVEDESSRFNGLEAGYQEDQLSLARQLQAEFGSGSKKSKKDKKRHSASQTPTEELEPLNDYFPASKSSSNFGPIEDLSTSQHPSVPEQDAPDGLTAGYRAEQLELARQLKEEFGSSTKKSKKDKKRQVLRDTTQDDLSDNQTATPEISSIGTALEEQTLPSADPEEESISATKKSKKGKKRQGLLRTATEDEFSSDSAAKAVEDVDSLQASIDTEPVLPTEEFALPSKKSKKDKKRQGLSRSATEDTIMSDSIDQTPENVLPREDPVSIPAEEDFVMPTKKSKKDKKRESSLRATTADDGFLSDNQVIEPEIQEAIVTSAASIPLPQEEDFETSTKKSKKDKKRQSKVNALDEQSPPSNVAIESTSPVDNEASQEIHLQPLNEPAAVVAEDESIFSTKKSKKEKKRQSQSLAGVTSELPTVAAPETDEKGEPDVDPETSNTAIKALPVEDEDDSVFSTKKSKKDKKKKRNIDLQEETLEQPVTDTSLAGVEVTAEETAIPTESAQVMDELPAEFEFSGKKSKKDKKKRQSSAQTPTIDDATETVQRDLDQPDSSKDTLEPVVETGDASLQEASKPEIDDFELPTKKAKKDKKKRQNLQSPAWDGPVEQSHEFSQATEEVNPASETVPYTISPEDNQEPQFEVTSKKSKKDKKKRKSLPGTPANEEVAEIVSEPINTEPELLPADLISTTAPQAQHNDQPSLTTEPEVTVTEVERVGGKESLDEFAAKASKKDKKNRKESVNPEAIEVSSASVTTNPNPENFEETDPSMSNLSRSSSKKDKRKRQTTNDAQLTSTTTDPEQAHSSWADEVEEIGSKEVSQNANIPEGPLSVLDSKADIASADDFFRPTKKGKKGKKKNQSNTFDEPFPTAGVIAPPTETESAEGVEAALSFARDSAESRSDNVARRSTEPEDEHTNRSILAAAGAALTGTALLHAVSNKDGESSSGLNKASSTPATTPSKKPSKKDKRKKYVDRRPAQQDDIFDDPMLWEGVDPKAHEEVNASGDDDGFWSAPNHEPIEEETKASEEPVFSTGDPFITQERTPETMNLETARTQSPVLTSFDGDKTKSQTDSLPTQETPSNDKEPDDWSSKPPATLSQKDKKKKKKERMAGWDTTEDELQPAEQIKPAKQERSAPQTNPTDAPVISRELSIEDALPRSWSPALSPRGLRHSGSFGLPVLREDAEWDKSEDNSARQHLPSDANRDSGLVTDSPTPLQRGFLDDHEHIRDSGVHLRDLSPAENSRNQITADEAIARLSWPVVNEETETVDLDQPQRLRSDREAKTPTRAGDTHDRLDPVKKGERYGDVKSSRPLAEKIKLFESTGTSPSSREQPRSSSVQSQRSISNINRLRTPDPKIVRPDSVGSNRSNASATPPLRRSDRKSGDLRSLSQRSNVDLAKEAELAAITTTSISPSNVTPSTANPTANEGRVRAKDMADVYDGFGEGRIGSPRSPTRPHSMRRRQSMQVLELESRLEQLASENYMLAEAKAQAEQSLQTTQKAASTLADRDAEIDSLKQSLDWLHREVNRLTEVNEGLTSAQLTLDNQHNSRYGQLETQHAQTTRELEEVRIAHQSLSAGMGGIVENEVRNTMAEKDREIAQLRSELEAAKEKIRAMQREILLSKTADSEFLVTRDEDYFDTACQQLCQHVQQWVLRFSKFSDMRACRLTSEINNDKIIDRLDNAILDGSDVDNYLADRVKRRDVFMSMTMTMVWEFVFTRYLFGMDREQRQKLKSLEKLLMEVGPPAAVHQWRATTLTLLAKRKTFLDQRKQDTEAVVHEILNTLFEILPPPTQLEDQIGDQLRRVMKAAVDLSIEMRTQRAEYMMLPPLQPEYDANGDLASKVSFNAALMNERSGDTVSNEELEAQKAVVRVVLFPLVVKKGDDRGEGDEEIVVCPAQVLVAKPKKTVRVFSPGSIDNRSRASMQSTLPPAEYGEGMEGGI
ncbi:hypothetical protein PVAG01_09562 [Phlyctema vagabunda]|uniref:Involucrin repeat protein n=1 Tax=Phlyctema vagabunda TaxID=108571 RepID=A0ABR4P7R6_9HELO